MRPRFRAKADDQAGIAAMNEMLDRAFDHDDEVEMTTSEKLDHTLKAYGRLEVFNGAIRRERDRYERALRDVVSARYAPPDALVSAMDQAERVLEGREDR